MGDSMTDLEITKACAEAMELTHEWDDKSVWLKVDNFSPGCEAQFIHKRGHFFNWIMRYDPLKNDEQSMALVKKFRLQIEEHQDGNGRAWGVFPSRQSESQVGVFAYDLNRAICECVSKMQRAKHE